MLVCRRNGFMSVTKGIDAQQRLSGAGGDSGWAERHALQVHEHCFFSVDLSK